MSDEKDLEQEFKALVTQINSDIYETKRKVSELHKFLQKEKDSIGKEKINEVLENIDEYELFNVLADLIQDDEWWKDSSDRSWSSSNKCSWED